MLYFAEEKHLGTTFEIQIISDNEATRQVIDELFLYCRDFESEFSRFLPTSSLSGLNREKSLRVSPRFIALLSRAREMEVLTHGDFSPCIDIASLGYSQDFDTGVFERRENSEKSEKEYTIYGDIVTLSSSTTLDFGGIGKGYLVDQLADILRQRGYHDFCINGGGDLILSGKNDEGEEWVIGIEDPKSGEICSTLMLSGVSVATSGSYRRRWEIDGKPYHHIIDAHTGDTIEHFLSVTLIGKDTTRIDALTKSIWHTPFEKLEEKLREYDVDGIIIAKNGKIFVSPRCLTHYQFQMQD